MKQVILTIITNINPDKSNDLEKLLFEIESDLEHNSILKFPAITLLHFACFVIISGQGSETYLIFENNFDDTIDNYLEQLTQEAGPGLHKIYSCCSDYNEINYDKTRLITYLRHAINYPNTYHIGNVGRSAVRIQQECQLREQVEDYIDTQLRIPGNKVSVLPLRNGIQNFARTNSLFSSIKSVGPRQTFIERFLPWLHVTIFLIGLIIFLPVLIPAGILWVIVLRRVEKADMASKDLPSVNHLQNLVEREDKIAQNHIATITTVKPGWFRQITLRMVLWVANLLARTSNKGELSGIPSIHFAHWALIENGKRLLFFSNYDGSWSSYLDDFIDKASRGLTGIWSNTVGFPKTRFLILDGARNEAAFKAYARASQLETLVWYSAYPKLTVQIIDKDSLIRENLYTSLNGEATTEWLKLF